LPQERALARPARIRAAAQESAPPGSKVGKDVRMSERAGDVADTADQRREQMLRAALEVIEERGFPETRIADVAARAGTSPALVIYYFKTKDQLLTEALRYAEDSWYEAGKRRMAAIPCAAMLSC
jgi:AcrR family transcriptional regulator